MLLSDGRTMTGSIARHRRGTRRWTWLLLVAGCSSAGEAGAPGGPAPAPSPTAPAPGDPGDGGVSDGPAAPLDVFVSPAGSDSASGLESDPVRTLPEAQRRVRTLLPRCKACDVRVLLSPGTHFLSEPLVFGAGDAGGGGRRVVYQSRDPANPAVLSGGVQISMTREGGARPFHYASLAPNLDFSQLYTVGDIPGQRPIKARHPKSSRTVLVARYHLDEPTYSPGVELAGRLELPPTAYAGSELVIQRDFSQSRLRVASVTTLANGNSYAILDTAAAAWELALRQAMNLTDATTPLSHTAYFEGTAEIWDLSREDGEWSYHRTTGALLYSPRGVDRRPVLTAFYPRLETLLRIGGPSGPPVRGLSFENLELRHTTLRRAEPYVGTQAGYHILVDSSPGAVWGKQRRLPAGIEIDNASDVRVHGCTIAQMGGQAIHVDEGTAAIDLSGNYLSEISGNGIAVSAGGIPTDPLWQGGQDLVVSKDLTIADNTIVGVGRDYDGIGVFVTSVQNASIVRNRIKFASYSGISFGWGWGWDSSAHPELTGNTIAYNDISTVMTNTRDGGGIYTLPSGKAATPERDLQIHDNYVHDFYGLISDFTGTVSYQGSPTCGIYLDDGTADAVVARNYLFALDHGIALQSMASAEAHENVISENLLFRTNSPLPQQAHFATAPQFKNRYTSNAVLSAPTPGARAIASQSGPSEAARARWDRVAGYANLGLFRVGDGIYYSYGGSYCGYSAWDDFSAAWGVKDARMIPAWDRLPPGQTNLGACK